MLRAGQKLSSPCLRSNTLPNNGLHLHSIRLHLPSNQLCIRSLTTSQRRAITQSCNVRVTFLSNKQFTLLSNRTLSTKAKFSFSLESVKDVIKRNVSGYTRVMFVFLGLLLVVIVVAEQAMAKDQIVVDVLPEPPQHGVVKYDRSQFKQISVPTQLFKGQTKLLNLHGSSGCGLTEFIRQYGVFFKEQGPHLYYKLNRISNRRSPQVFVLNGKSKVSLGHSLAHLVAKLRQKVEMGEEGEDKIKSMLSAASVGLRKHSRWLLVFEDVPDNMDILNLLEGYEDWGDGQIIISSTDPIPGCDSVSLKAIVPRSTLQRLYFNVAPNDDLFDPELLYKTFGYDLHSVIAAANIVKIETENGNKFSFEDLLEHINTGDPRSNVLKLCTALTALEHPKLLFAFDFIGKMPKGVPIPTAYLLHHMRSTMYDAWFEAVYHYSVQRNTLLPKSEPVLNSVPELPKELSYYKQKKVWASEQLGLDPSKGWWEQVSEIIWPPVMPVHDNEETALLKSCPLLKVNPVYGGHISTITVTDDIHDIFSSLHTQFTAPLLEAAIVLQKDIAYHNTWISRWMSFDQKGQTLKAREVILGKGHVNPDSKDPSHLTSLPVLDSVLFYKTSPISPDNLTEYSSLLTKQVLKTLISHVDTVTTATVAGLIESLFLAELISHQIKDLEPPFSGLARSCSLHLSSELGEVGIEELMKEELARTRLEDPRGPSLASALHRYGAWLHNHDRDTEARPLLEEAVSFADSLALNRTMGLVASELDELGLAQTYLERAIEAIKPGDEALLGPLLTDLGQVHLLQGKTGMGIRYLQGAINGYKQQVGTDNPEYARTLNIVSIGHLMMGDVERSRRARGESGNVLAALRKGNILVTK